MRSRSYTALLNPLFEKRNDPRSAKKDDGEDKSNELVVVQLIPLSEDQYRSLAAGAEVRDVDRFVDAIGKNGLAALTERPGDLLDLADYWKSHGKFSSFSEMLDHSISRKLAERDPYRPDNETISPEAAREGAERLAGALAFGKSFTLRAPGHDPDPSLAAGALNSKEILPIGLTVGGTRCCDVVSSRLPLMAKSGSTIVRRRNICCEMDAPFDQQQLSARRRIPPSLR